MTKKGLKWFFQLECLFEVCGDKSTSYLVPNGARSIGGSAMTTRGLGEDFKKIVHYIDWIDNYAKKDQRVLPKEANKFEEFKAKISEGSDQLI